jgi:hypothetical protein
MTGHHTTICLTGQGISRRIGGAYFTSDDNKLTTARTTYKPRGKIYHNSTRTRNIATTMDMLMILTLEDLALRNNQMFDNETLYNNR